MYRLSATCCTVRIVRVIRKPVQRVMRALPCNMLALLMSEYRRGCPVTSWVDLERLCGIGEAGLHVDSAMRRRRTGRCDAMLLPGRMVQIDGSQHGWIPAWIAGNHRPIVQAIERQLPGGARSACARPCGVCAHWGGWLALTSDALVGEHSLT